MGQALGQVETVSAGAVTASLDDDLGAPIGIGTMVKVACGGQVAVGTISAIGRRQGAPPRRVLTVDLLGEIAPGRKGTMRFLRGVSKYPEPGAAVIVADEADLEVIYARPSAVHVRIGTLYHDTSRPSYLMTDDLLAKHFAVLGTSGSGKSCAVTLILRAVLGHHPNAHIVLLDPHNEYESAFGELAEVINIDNLKLPFWLLNLEESVEALVRGGTPGEQQSQAIILKDSIVAARRKYAGNLDVSWITVDTPVPYRIGDLVAFIEAEMGKLNKPDSSIPYTRLKWQIESLNADRRFSFMFSGIVMRDTLTHVIGGLLRIPVGGKPVTIIDLSDVPSEIVNVVVSLLCRVTFDFCLWAKREQMPPVLLVCEEAHRYVPAAAEEGFAATRRAIARIAKEGRKYGVSLGLVTQRPSELATSALSQCGTIFALRMGNDLDQRFVANNLPESAQGLLQALPSMRPQEAIVVGEGVPMPMRVRFDDLPPDFHPRSRNTEFSKSWQRDDAGAEFLEESIRSWRRQIRRGAPRAGPAA
jgi:DNA helicase HerA-like ATPase